MNLLLRLWSCCTKSITPKGSYTIRSYMVFPSQKQTSKWTMRGGLCFTNQVGLSMFLFRRWPRGFHHAWPRRLGCRTPGVWPWTPTSSSVPKASVARRRPATQRSRSGWTSLGSVDLAVVDHELGPEDLVQRPELGA